MKLRINQLLCIFMFFGVFPLQGYARSNTPETEIQALVKEPDPSPMMKECIEYAQYRILKITETLFFQGEQ